jgi:hypothetical protein
MPIMRLPEITGIIKRRILVNYRVQPSVVAALLPQPFRPKLHRGHAIAGICLIRLEKMRPAGMPGFIGISSENVAHRVAVEWDDGATVREGVFIFRRDTDSLLNHYAGGRIFPGEQHFANFAVRDSGGHIGLRARTEKGVALVELRGFESDTLPAGSVFGSVEESSRFFECGCAGFSLASAGAIEGMKLVTRDWRVRPFEVEIWRSRFFADAASFPEGSVVFDHAIIMRDIAHEWQPCEAPAVSVKRIAG